MEDQSSMTGIQNGDDDLKKRLIINYLPRTLTDYELHALFSTIGPVWKCRIAKDPHTGLSLCYGFVEFQDPSDAEHAIETLNGLPLYQKTIKVSFAGPPSVNTSLTNLYVAHLPRNITETYLEEVFGVFGRIVQQNVLKNKFTGESIGVGFVRYDNTESAQKAIIALNGKIPKDGTLPLIVKIADRKRKKNAPLRSLCPPMFLPRLVNPALPVPSVLHHNVRVDLDGRVTPFLCMNEPRCFGETWSGKQFRYNPVRYRRSDDPLARYNPIGNGGGYF